MRSDKRIWINREEVVEPSTDIFRGFIDEHTTPWIDCRIGFLPQRCVYSDKLVWPFTKATQRILMHVSDTGLYSKRFYACNEEAVIANLKMDY